MVALTLGALAVGNAWAQNVPAAATPQYDPHDLAGVWGGPAVLNGGAPPDPNAPPSTRMFNYGIRTPEPPLTDWAKKNLLMKSISHDALGPNGRVADVNGVPANDPKGEYPGKNCEPLGMPAVLDYSSIGPFEFVYTKAGDRIIQLMEYHREWRTLWLDGEHPKDLDPTYMGHSVARWEGDTLIVDTVGYNGKNQLMMGVAHRMSDAFHLVERYRRVAYDRLELEMTMFDDKAWGDKSWTGFKKTFALLPDEELQEFICVPSEYKEYDDAIDNASK